jgi:septum formation protein
VAATRLILASGSPQRRAILRQIGIAFEVRIPEVDELSDGPAAEVALENAYRKASAIGPAELPVLGVDTVVSLGLKIFGKPRDATHAAEMLGALAGRTHVVVSGICLIDGERVRTAASHTAVEFRALDPAAVAAYVRTGEWAGRAGAYAIQGRGATLVSRIEGDYLNVVGLPVAALLDLSPDLIAG